jgi:hypothetical protein
MFQNKRTASNSNRSFETLIFLMFIVKRWTLSDLVCTSAIAYRSFPKKSLEIEWNWLINTFDKGLNISRNAEVRR